VELDKNDISQSSANFLDCHKQRSARSSGPTNYPDSGDVTADHMITGNGQYFVLDADAVNRDAFLSSQRRNMVN